MIRTIRTHYDPIREYHASGSTLKEKGLQQTLNDIGWENVLQVLPCYCGNGEYFYTIIYKENKDGRG